MKTLTSGSVEDAARQIAKQRGLEAEIVRKAIFDAIRIGNLDKGYGFLSFAGILPVFLPDGTKVAVLPDIHAPAHHKRIIWAVKQWLKDFQPHILIVIGDLADMFALSRWPKPPRVAVDGQKELDESRRLLDSLIEISGALYVFVIMGNHEDRIRRYLTDPASGLAGIVDFSTREPILSFHQLMGYKPGDPVIFLYDAQEAGGYGGGILVNGEFEFHHGYIVRPNPGASPRADADNTGRSTAHGHTHRAGMGARETTNGAIRWFELGHLADPTHAYLGYANLLNNWHPAVGSGLVVGGKLHLQVLPIKQVSINGQPRFVFTYAGNVYTQSDR